MVDVITLFHADVRRTNTSHSTTKQMTLAQVSRLSAIPKGTLSKIENGVTKLLISNSFYLLIWY